MAEYMVIGGASGTGAELVRQLIEGGNNVHATSSRRDLPGTQWFDARSPGELVFPERLDGLVYCPGTIRLKPFHRLTKEEFLDDFTVNCLGAVAVIQQCLPALKRSASPSIVLFSTIAAAQGMAFHASIASAKGAVEGLVRSLAAEFAPAIRVNAIAPTLTDTPLAAALLDTDAKRDAARKRNPLQEVGNPADIAAMARFLLGAESRMLSGQILRPDAGLSSIRLFQ